MSSAERRKQEREDIRRAILDSAKELLTSGDYENVSMRRIAEKINYSPTAIYLHFKDKGELMDALAAEGFALMVGTMENMQADDPIERLRRIGHAYVAFALANRPVYHLMFQLGNSPEDRYGEHTTRRASGTRAFDLLVETVRQIGEMEDAPFPEETNAAALAAGVFWGHIHGVVSLILTGRGRLLAGMQPQFCRQAVETAVAGLLAELSRKR